MRFSEAIRDELAGFRPNGYLFGGITGAIAAALAADAAVFAARFPAAGLGATRIDWLHLHYVCLTNLTAAVAAGRRLHLERGSGADASGGAAITTTEDNPASSETKLVGRVATTVALTMAGIALENTVPRRMTLSHAGVAGNSVEALWTFEDHPLVLAPGALIAITAGALFDAAGTWQLTVTGHATQINMNQISV